VEGVFCRHGVGLWVVVTVVGGLVFDGWDVADLAVAADLVVPPHPVEGGEIEIVDASPRSFVADTFGLVEPDHRLGHRIVETFPWDQCLRQTRGASVQYRKKTAFYVRFNNGSDRFADPGLKCPTAKDGAIPCGRGSCSGSFSK